MIQYSAKVSLGVLVRRLNGLMMTVHICQEFPIVRMHPPKVLGGFNYFYDLGGFPEDDESGQIS